ncbi:hypothetical protein AB0D90_03520 [Streptomyces althioticus]|uniref:hypothetical protein n=1 Tax=Streptomyces althioticus TaxID=83380 RepID=UPI0033E08260
MKAFAQPVVTAGEIHVTLLPPGHIDYRLRLVRVVRIDPAAPEDRQWAVLAAVDQCLGRDGIWCDDPKPRGRDEEWLAAHRFSVGEALRLAQDACASVTVSGVTTAQVVERDGAAEGRGQDSTRALKEVRTVASRAETASAALHPRWEQFRTPDEDAPQMRSALEVVAALLGHWRRTDQTARR